jgi:MFS family permease
LFGVMLLMPFVFERAYHDDPLAAGLRLSIIPVAISLLAPVSGVLYDRFGARLPTLSGMIICAGALLLLVLVLKQGPGDLLQVMVALGIFGIGQGLFTAANNSAIMASAPPDLTGEAGGLLNVTRAFGISLGIASASAVLTWRLAGLGDPSGSTVHVHETTMLAASREVVGFLMLFAIGAALASALPKAPPAPQSAPRSAPK